MANYWNFKSVIVLEKDPFVKDPTVTKISALPKSTGADPVKPVSLEIYTNDETKRVEYSLLRCPSVFTQRLGEMCLDTKMIRLYKHFVLCRSILLSEYWRENPLSIVTTFPMLWIGFVISSINLWVDCDMNYGRLFACLGWSFPSCSFTCLSWKWCWPVNNMSMTDQNLKNSDDVVTCCDQFLKNPGKYGIPYDDTRKKWIF